VPHLILSDIHANWEALEAVLADAAGQYERILCLGDLVGYGAEPNRIVDWARGEGSFTAVRGNHDRASAGLDDLEDYNAAARASAIWTRRSLTQANRLFLEKLPRGPLRVEDAGAPFDLAHGSPLDEDNYLIQLADVQHLRPYLETPLTFIGHTHVQGGFVLSPEGVQRILPPGVLELAGDVYLINPGSVGQPRDGDPRASYALYWPEDRVVEYRRVEYDIAGAAAKIRRAGLPDALAARLERGT
jgi:diadenosine tetraphosphatase ApaH/serine/threonine PP2A family protein phosphatase